MKKIIAPLLALALILAPLTSCTNGTAETSGDTSPVSEATLPSESSSGENEGEGSYDVEHPRFTSDMSAEDIVSRLTLEQKASQMVQGDIKVMDPAEMKDNGYGSVLSIPNDYPCWNKDTWISKIREFQTNAMSSASGIPYIYGQDTVHGVYGVDQAIIYPHNINIGAANDPGLTEEYGKLTASDMKHVGTVLNFGPCVADAQDPRWGRTYESISSDLNRVTELASAFVRGQIGEGVVVCPKHYLADGHSEYGTGEDSDTQRLIDRGDAKLTEDQINELAGVYKALIDEGAQVIMISHSSINGVKMHENGKYIMKLKDEFGFKGFILSDWESIHNCSGKDLYENVVLAVNAGIDMLMEDKDYEGCRDIIVEAVGKGDITEERVNDAVTRIISVKLKTGLFDDPMLEKTNPSYDWASEEGKACARKLAAESFVPIKAGKNLTIPAGAKVFLAGPAANDTGALCGGWTMMWTGISDKESGTRWVTNATTIEEGLREAAEAKGFEIVTDPALIGTCDMVLLCLGEEPYAEWLGDTEDLSITGKLGMFDNKAAIKLAKDSGLPTTALIVSGRNVILEDYINDWDSAVMLYLPGSEGGHAVADVLTGDIPFTGTLPMPYYASVDDIAEGKCKYEVGYSAVK